MQLKARLLPWLMAPLDLYWRRAKEADAGGRGSWWACGGCRCGGGPCGRACAASADRRLQSFQSHTARRTRATSAAPTPTERPTMTPVVQPPPPSAGGGTGGGPSGWVAPVEGVAVAARRRGWRPGTEVAHAYCPADCRERGVDDGRATVTAPYNERSPPASSNCMCKFAEGKAARQLRQIFMCLFPKNVEFLLDNTDNLQPRRTNLLNY